MAIRALHLHGNKKIIALV